jgi:hypothetical protein
MDSRGAHKVVPALRPQDADMLHQPWITDDNFNAGYIQRGVHLLPRQGDRAPWLHSQDYASERQTLPTADLEDGSLVYG